MPSASQSLANRADASSSRRPSFHSELANIIAKKNQGDNVRNDCWELMNTARSKPNFYESIQYAIDKCSNSKTLLGDLFCPDNMSMMKNLSYTQRANIVSRVMACPPNRGSQLSSVSQQRHDRSFSEYQSFLNLNDTDFRGKNILLVGGGDSNLRSSLRGATITNIDLHKPASRRASHHHIQGNFCNSGQVIRGRRDRGQNEVWCLFSLPMYARSVTETKKFFSNAISSLSDNGVLRIFPAFEKSPLASQSHSIYSLVNRDLEGLERNIMSSIASRPDLFEVSYYQQSYRHGIIGGRGTSQNTGVNIRIRSGQRSDAVNYLQNQLRHLTIS